MILEPISKILVSLDGSKSSVKGLEMAIRLARECNASITGIHVIDSPSRTEFGGVGTVSERYRSRVDKFMARAQATVEKHGITFKKKVVKGNLGYNIVKTAQGKDHYDLIVIGSRGRSSTKEIFFGSVSNYVVHTSQIPVLVVR